MHADLLSKIQPIEKETLLANAIFNNNNLKLKREQKLFLSTCFNKGIKFINDITVTDGNLFSFQEAKDNLNILLNYLQYQSICQAIEEWKKILKIKKLTEELENPIRPFWQSVYNVYEK